MIDNLPINLESLLDLSAKLNETHDEQFILNSALLSLMGKLTVIRAVALIPCKNIEKYNVIISKGKFYDSQFDYFEVSSFRKVITENSPEKILFDNGIRYLIPVIYHNQLLALICIGQKINDNDFSTQEIHYSNLVATITGNALQHNHNHLALLNTKDNLEHRNQMLTTLFEMNRDFSTLLSRPQIIKMTSYRLMGQLMVSRFAIFLINDKNIYEPIINRFDCPIPDKIINDFVKINKTEIIDNLSVITQSGVECSEAGIKITSPMKMQGEVKGIILIGKKMNGENFTAENLLFIEAIGNTAIAALENERLFQEELEKKKLENELNLALEIQKNFLPKKIPVVEGFEFAGSSIPSRHVGGDYYDFVVLPDGHIMVVIADVSGKGMPASLIMANVQAALRVLAPLPLKLKDMLNKINKIVYQNTSAEKFVTFFCGILDPENMTFRYINAGHNPPFIFRRDKSVHSLTEGGLILGITDDDLPYFEGNFQLLNGDLILLYTDGVTEAKNPDDEDYSEDLLQNVVSVNLHQSAETLMKIITDDVLRHQNGRNQYDDITMSLIKIN